jgi:alanyl-tRNA synthetase
MALVKGDKGESLPGDVKTTGRLYYEDPYARQADGKVLRVHGDWVAMDQTIFFPEGGGQPGDLGTLSIGSETFHVGGVRYASGAIFHHLDRPVPESLVGERMAQKIDWDRRYRLMKAHTTTHVLNATLREVLGFHVRQMGSQNGVDSTRFDIAHYKNIGPDETAAIEERVNAAIFAGAEVTTDVMRRGDAEAQYGFFIYQGGFVPFDELRIVKVDGIDTEACAGTHLKNIQEVSLFKLLGVSQIQNNVYRLRYSVGDAALHHYQESEGVLNEIMKLLGSARDVTLQKVTRLFEDNKDQAKQLGDLEESLLQINANASRVERDGAPTTYFFKSSVSKDRAMRHIVRMARTGKKQAYFVVFSDGAVFIRSKDLDSLNFRDSAALFSGYEVANASPDMMVFTGELEAGAAWDVARKVLAG